MRIPFFILSAALAVLPFVSQADQPPSPAGGARLPAWTPADGARISEWLFQPGEAVSKPPQAEAWEAVKVPFLWTSGGGRMLKPAGRPPAEWARSPKAWKAHDNGWFERTISVPAAWAGQRVWLAFDQVECDGLLWVDGGDPIPLEGPEARVDITARLKPGREATLRVWVTRWWKDLPRPRKDSVLRAEAVKVVSRERKGGEDALRQELPAGLPGYVTLEVRPLMAEVTGVFARPSFREKALLVDVDLNTDPREKPAAAVRVQILDAEGQGGALPPAVTVPLTVTGTGTQTVRLPWASPRLWQLGDGYLYQIQATVLDAEGRALHTAEPAAFGFRELWVEGREIKMNGRPIRLRLAPVIFPSWPALLFWEGIGFNAAQWHPNSGSWFSANGQRSLIISDQDNPGMRRITPDVIEQADRRGFALLMPSPNVGYVVGALNTPEGEAAYERECRLWFKRLRNHPSIIMWNPSMNKGSVTRENPERIGTLPDKEDHNPDWTARTNAITKRVDPTRIVAHHCGTGGEIDYPNQYLNFMPLQERIEFPSRWAEKGDIPWGAIEHGTPYVANFMKPLAVPQFTEWSAVYFGDRAYAQESDDYVKLVNDFLADPKRRNLRGDEFARISDLTLHHEFDTLFTRETNRSWRAWGVAGGWKPWNFMLGYGVPPALKGKPNGEYFYTQLTESEALATIARAPEWANATYHAYRETMQPLLVYLGGRPERFTAKDHAFRAGEKFEKTLVAVWDGNTPQRLDAVWKLELAGKTVQTGEIGLSLQPGDIVRKPFTLTAPAVSARTDARLILTVKTAGGGLIEDAMDLSFWPAEPAVKLQSRWALYDPAGRSAAWLRTLGLDPIVVENRAQLAQSRADVLVVARGALGVGIPFDADLVARGLRVLVLEQRPEALESIGLRIQDIVTRFAFPRDRGHPALREIEAADLANWRGEPDLLPKTKVGMKPWPLARPPHWGNYGAVASVVIETPAHGAFTPLAEAEFDLAYSPLLEWRHGRGGVIFSQFDLTGRTALDPVARRIAGNLLRALDQPYPANNDKIVRYLGDDAGWAYVSTLGLEIVRADPAAPAGLSPATDILIVGKGAWAAQREAAGRFAAAGGTVLVLPQPGRDLTPFKTAEARSARVAPGPDPVLRGIGPQRLNWRTFLAQERFTNDGLTGETTRLADGLVLTKPEGRGRLVFSQLDWSPLEDGKPNLEKQRWHTAGFYRQLLTNLGARTEPGIAGQLFRPRQIAPLVNVQLWRVWNSVAKAEPVTKEGTFPALTRRLPVEAAKAEPEGAGGKDDRAVAENIGEGEVNMPGLNVAASNAGWRTYGPRKSSGRVHLDWVSPAETGKIGYARTYVYSSRPRDALFAVGGDFWMVFSVNGKAFVDHGRQARPSRTPFAGEFRFKAPLKAGWNLLEAKVASGSSGFGFWAMMSDPGDAAFETNPKNKPDAPVPAVWPEEPDLETKEPLYVRPLRPEDDPYRFNPW